MPDIFLSYRRGDTAGHAGRLFDGLQSRFHGSRIFMDVDAIEAGADFVDRIAQAVASCDVLLVLIGDDWLEMRGPDGARRLDNSEDFVRLEVKAALERDVKIIPVLVERAPMPAAEDLPEDIRRLSRHNAIELSDERWHYDMSRLINVIANLDRAKRASGQKTAGMPWFRRRAVLGLGAAVLAAVVVAAVVLGGGGGGGGGASKQQNAAALFGNSPANPAGRFEPNVARVGSGAATSVAVGMGSVWVVNRQNGAVTKVDPKTGKPAAAPVVAGRTLDDVSVGQGALWATSEDDRSIVRIDPAKGAVTGSVPIGGFPLDVAAGAGAVWAVDQDHGLKRIDPQRLKVVTQIDIGHGAQVAVGDFSQVAATEEGKVVRVDPDTNKAGTAVALGQNADGLAWDDSGNVWASDPGAGTVTGIGDNGQKRVVNVGGEPHEVAFGAGSIWVLDSSQADQVSRIDPTRAQIVGRPIKVGPNATSFAADDDGLWVGYSDGTLRRIKT